MGDQKMLTTIDGATLAAAFPVEHRASAMSAGIDAAQRLTPRQWTEQFCLRVGCDTVLIPARLHFASEWSILTKDTEAWRFARALQTRSNDGFERQRAARDLLRNAEPWAVPFIVTLIGEYVVEILDDVHAAMTPQLEQDICEFITHNPDFWHTIKQRVASYWNVYYRARWLGDHHGRAETREEYVGCQLIQQIGSAASRYGSSASCEIGLKRTV